MRRRCSSLESAARHPAVGHGRLKGCVPCRPLAPAPVPPTVRQRTLNTSPVDACAVMPRKEEYRHLSNEQLYALVSRDRRSGMSIGQIARKLGVSAGLASRWCRNQFPPPPSHAPRLSAPSSTVEAVREAVTEGVVDAKELEERIRLRDRVGVLGEQMDHVTRSLDAISRRLEAMDRKPLQVDSHEGRADVSCPTCGTHAVVETRRPAEQFDQVLAEFDVPHPKSPTGKAFDCPTCRPKIDAKLKEYGLALSKVSPGRH